MLMCTYRAGRTFGLVSTEQHRGGGGDTLKHSNENICVYTHVNKRRRGLKKKTAFLVPSERQLKMRGGKRKKKSSKRDVCPL